LLCIWGCCCVFEFEFSVIRCVLISQSNRPVLLLFLCPVWIYSSFYYNPAWFVSKKRHLNYSNKNIESKDVCTFGGN
jgi:hypothetical protein